jgi:hypothetical protein
MQLRCLTSFQTAVHKSASADALRPCQRAYLGESNARRLLRRAQLSKKPGSAEYEQDPIFTLHQEAYQEAAAEAFAAAAATPFTSSNRPAAATGYSVECYATHVEDEKRRKEAAATEKEKLVLLHSINSSRQAEGVHPLRLQPLLCKLAQDQADLLAHEDAYPSTIRPSNNNDSVASPNSVTVVMSPFGARVARLISPPHMGALACGEMWYGGKYRRHLYSLSTETAGEHPENCPCHLRMVFETMVDGGWEDVGIGRGVDGRWVVELME